MKKAVDSKRLEQNPFWAWSLKIYAKPAVARGLLNLQDQFGLNVNLLLWMLWPDNKSAGDDVSRAWMQEAEQINRTYTQPLRAMRQRLKGQPHPTDLRADLREKIKQAELASEHWQQDILFQLGEGRITQPPSGAKSLFCEYLTLHAGQWSEKQKAEASKEFDSLARLVAL